MGSTESNVGVDEKTGAQEKGLVVKKASEVEVVQLKVHAYLGFFSVLISSVKGDLAQLQMKRKLTLFIN